MMRTLMNQNALSLATLLLTTLFFSIARAADVWTAPVTNSASAAKWAVGEPIVTYFAGPDMSEAVATQMAEGGFNCVWCKDSDLNLLARHHLRGMIRSDLLSPATLDHPDRRQQLDAMIERVAHHPAMYSYFITDEPAATAFPDWGKLVWYLRQHDPAHLAYINLFPTYATNQQLGTKGDVVAAYRDYLKQFIQVAKPDLLSYDHYQFYKAGDSKEYFLNLNLVREAAQQAGIPFLNIIQAAAWQPAVRVPTANETRYLVYTTAAYGAQGISYYVYSAPGHEGGIARADGTPTPIYETLKSLNPEFVAVARQLQPLRSVGVYHTTMKEPGCVALPADASFHPLAAPKAADDRGLLLGCFSKPAAAGTSGPAPTHALVVNLNYRAEEHVELAGPRKLQVFDATAGTWSPAESNQIKLDLAPGGGRLVRVAE